MVAFSCQVCFMQLKPGDWLRIKKEPSPNSSVSIDNCNSAESTVRPRFSSETTIHGRPQEVLAGHYVTVSDLEGHWQISFHYISFSCAKGACSEGDDARRTDSVVGKDDALNETDFQTRMVIAQEDAYRLHVMPSEGSVELHTANAKAVQQKTISSIPSAAVLVPLPTAADPMQTRWMATERAAQRFIAGVMQRVPLATVNHTETDDVLSVAPSIPHVSCIVAASDVVWVESTLIEVGAVPTAFGHSRLYRRSDA